MTHHSSYRYGEHLHEPPSVSRGCSEVRVSYFDPRTGKPCKEKPKPLRIQHEKGQTAIEHFEQRQKDVAEAAEIARNMKERNAKERKAKAKPCKAVERKPSGPKKRGRVGHPGRQVIVDGVMFPTVTAAASYIGTSNQHLCVQLRAGATKVKGRNVRFAKEEA